MVGYNLLNAYGPEGQVLSIEVPWEHEENELRILAATDVEDKFKLRLLGTDSYSRVGNVITVPYPFEEAGLPWRLFIWRVTDVNETVTFDGSRIPVEAIVAKLKELSEKVEEAQLLYRRAVKAPEDMDGHMILPTEKVRAGKVLGFDESGLPLSGLEYIPEAKGFLDKIRKLTEDSLAELDKIEKSAQDEFEKFVGDCYEDFKEKVADDKAYVDARVADADSAAASSEAAKTAAEAAAASTKTYNQGAWEAYSKTLDTLEAIKDLRARCETIYAEVSKYRYEVLTRDEYNAKVEAGTTEDDVLYFVKGSVDVGALVEKWNDAGMSDVPEKLDAEITRSTKADEDLGANIAEVGKEVDRMKTKLTSAMHYKGSVATKDLLPSEAHEPGDVWNVIEDGKNYAWDGTAWDDISGVMSIPQATTTTLGGVKLHSSTVGSTTGSAAVLLTATGCMVVPQATTTTAGVAKLGTAGQVPNNGGMVGLTSNGSFGLGFATESTGGSVRVGGVGIGISSGVLNLKIRENYSGLNFDNKALYVNCADETNHPAAADSASVAKNTDGKLCVPVATTSANGAVKIATSSSDTGVASVLTAMQVKSLLAAKSDNSHTHTIAQIDNLQSTLDTETSERKSTLKAHGGTKATQTVFGHVRLANGITDAGDHAVPRALTVYNALTAETTAREEADTALGGRVTTLESSVDGLGEALNQTTMAYFTLSTNLSTETSERKAADTNLQTQITTNATNITNALSKTATAQQSVAGEVKFNGGIRADSIKTLYGTEVFQTVSAKGFAFSGVYTITPLGSTTPFFESTVSGGTNTIVRATTIYEGGTALASKYATKTHTHAISDVANLQTTLDGKQDVLTAGDNITIVDGVISATGGGTVDAYTKAEVDSKLSGKVGYTANPVLIGLNAHSIASSNVSIGYGAYAGGFYSTALGNNASAKGDRSTALGSGATTKDSWSLALGYNAAANHGKSIVLSSMDEAVSVGANTFNAVFGGGVAGFYIDGVSLGGLLDAKADAASITTLETTVASKADATTVKSLQTTVEKKADNSDVIALKNSLGGFSIKAMCQEAYDELTEKDQLTMYYIIEESILNFELQSDGASYEVCPTDGYGTALNDCVFGDVVIPSTYKGRPVTSLYYYAFGNTTRLKSVVIPDSVTNLTVSSFQNSSVVSVTIPSSITVLPNSLFYECANLASITIPASVTEIQGYAFYMCSSLAYCKFEGNAPTVVGENQFAECPALTEIHVNSGTTGWGDTWCGKTVVVDNA